MLLSLAFSASHLLLLSTQLDTLRRVRNILPFLLLHSHDRSYKKQMFHNTTRNDEKSFCICFTSAPPPRCIQSFHRLCRRISPTKPTRSEELSSPLCYTGRKPIRLEEIVRILCILYTQCCVCVNNKIQIFASFFFVSKSIDTMKFIFCVLIGYFC